MLTRGRRPAATVLLLASALLITACTGGGNPAPKAPASVAIGLLVPTTGANAQLGQQATLGAKLAIELVNQDFKDLPLPLPLGVGAGLRNGTKLTLIAGNTESAPEKVEKEASRLVAEGAVGLVLADTIDVAAPAGRETDLIGVSLVDALSTSDTFADLNRTAHFRIQPSDRQLVSTALGLLYRQRDTPAQFKRIITAAGTPAGAIGGEVSTLKATIEDLSLAAGYEVGGKDKIVPLSGADAGQPDGMVVKGDAVLAIVTSAAEANAASELAVRLRGTAPVIAIGPGVGALDGVKSSGGVQALRAAGWSTEFAGRNPISRVVATMYEQAFHTKLTEVAAAAFTATMVLAMAMDQVTDFTPQSIRSAVQQITLPATQTIMPWNGIRFDGNGYNQLAAGVVEQHVPNGYQVVHPIELAATPTLSL
ncbi:ABC transporter substrate-binding protein [Dactylosporangium sp. AC04546]|uniref:ABC transporter substrate-binding protein n=1 Tax=Dactylosporangium sp. AC04546 TaxID=2862460 RepID=UPI001EDE0B7D|nr:ABC transporter substrate-binding protein [Dactylosporangium sp. AC04546]WVK83135.1 ABC transporter substrate-binding protein [Dactylosporangium sp. AC04546]